MQSEELRERFREFFEERGHKWVNPSSLIPTDPSVLLTSAGMQQFKKYYTSEADPMKDFGSLNTVSIQKCFRTSDIDEVGDETHNTFFEMLGNFSFGGYYKKEAIKWGYEFLTEQLGVVKSRIGATYFGGDKDMELDEDEEALRELKTYFNLEEIKAQGKEDNFWGPTGSEGPCGPTVEFYIDGVETWNLVFNEYYCDTAGQYEKLKTPGVDTGMGIERVLAVLSGSGDVFESDVLKPIADKIFSLVPNLDKKALRVLTDHLRASIFLIADGIRPSNKEAGYILRRLLRRIIAYQIKYDIHQDLMVETLPIVVSKFGNVYENINNESEILSVWQNEKGKFEIALANGIKALKVFASDKITVSEAFNLYQSYGLPLEIIKEIGGEAAKDLKEKDFEAEFAKHQELSRAGAEKKFGGHGLLVDTGEIKAKDEAELDKVTRLHTATHLLQAALRKVLGDEVHQMGSDITSERTRFDFSFGRKVTQEEIKKVEDLVNSVIEEDLLVQFVEMPLEDAKKTGALYSASEKYPSKVKVYYVGNSLERAFSKELCGGPHTERSGVLGKFKILKEEGVSAGVRRVRADVI